MRNRGMIIAGLVIVLLAVTFASQAFIMPGPGMMLGRVVMNGTLMNSAMMNGTLMNGSLMNGMMGGYRMPGYGLGATRMFAWPVLGALVIGAGVLAMLWFVRRTGPALFASSGRESPLDVLKLRYARGEITREQLEEMKQTIST